jgi:hypothetical protein
LCLIEKTQWDEVLCVNVRRGRLDVYAAFQA